MFDKIYAYICIIFASIMNMFSFWFMVFCILSISTVNHGFQFCETCTCTYAENHTVNIDCYGRRLGIQDFLPFKLLRIDSKLSIVSLKLSKNSISYIPNLGNIPNLTSLDLSDNIINSTNSALKSLTNLQILDLSLNKIQEVVTPLSLMSLRNLNLSHCEINNLIGLENSSLPNLANLDLSHNRLMFLNKTLFENLGNLTFLDLSFNRIESIDLSGFPRLTILKIEHNVIGSDAYFPTSLKKLYARHNKMTTLPKSQNHTQQLDYFNHLEFLDLSQNELATISNAMFVKLETLNLRQNKFLKLSDFLSVDNFPALKKLDISGNDFEKLEFSAKLKLETLLAEDIHSITTLNADSLKNLENHENHCLNLTFRNNSKLETFESTIFNSLNICFLDLSFNKFTHLHTFLTKFNNWQRVKYGIDFQWNPINCDCNSQLILDDFVPWIYSINAELLTNLRCSEPTYLKGKRLVHWYKWKRRVFCDDSSHILPRMEFLSSNLWIRLSSSNGMIIAIGITISLLTFLIVIGLILARRNTIKQIRKNRRF